MPPVVASLTPLLAIWLRNFERREMPGHGIESFANVVGIPRALPRPLGERLSHMGRQGVPPTVYDTVLRPNHVAFVRALEGFQIVERSPAVLRIGRAPAQVAAPALLLQPF